MAVAVRLSVAAPAWNATFPELETLVTGAVRAAVAVGAPRHGALAEAEVSLLLTDDAAMARLNGDHRGRFAPTNVLAFPQLEPAELNGGPDGREGPLLLGDVVLAWETVGREAAAAGKSRDAHIAHLVVHGVLHLLGYDHQEEEEALEMEGLEARALALLKPSARMAGSAGR